MTFALQGGELFVEDVPLARIAEDVGTPVYVYSRSRFEHNARAFRDGMAAAGDVRLAYAVKANPNLAVLRIMATMGYGADVVSAGEMRRALAAGIDPARIVFSGVGKTVAELDAGLAAGIGQFNLELEQEGVVLGARAAAHGGRASAVLRVNPDVDAGTHAKIATGNADDKFGVAIGEAPAIFDRLAGVDGLDLGGVAVHIGSQIQDLAPLEAAYRRVGDLIAALRARGHRIEHVDLGGGLGIAYRPGDVFPAPADLGRMIARVTGSWGVALTAEPGRVIAADAGVLLTRVIWVKPGAGHPWVIVDAAMNDLARPALYDAFHGFAAVRPTGARMIANIAGPVCESGDVFARDREIAAVRRGDLAVFETAGAYGATMASTYNSRPLVPQVLVDKSRYAIVAERVMPD